MDGVAPGLALNTKDQVPAHPPCSLATKAGCGHGLPGELEARLRDHPSSKGTTSRPLSSASLE